MPIATAGTHSRALRVPYRAVLPARHVAALAFAFPALVHLADTAQLVAVHARDRVALAAAVAMLLIRYGCAHAAFARRPPWTFAWIFAGALIAGQLEIFERLQGLGTAGAAFTDLAVALFFAGPCMQAAYGLAFAWVETRFVAEASDESADQAAVAAAVWLVASFPARSIVFSRTSALAHVTLSLDWIAALPFAVALLALARLILRRRWIARVSAGRDAQWHLLPWEGPLPPGLPAVVRMQPPSLPMVLATRRTAEVPYRSAESLEPRATLVATMDTIDARS